MREMRERGGERDGRERQERDERERERDARAGRGEEMRGSKKELEKE